MDGASALRKSGRANTRPPRRSKMDLPSAPRKLTLESYYIALQKWRAYSHMILLRLKPPPTALIIYGSVHIETFCREDRYSSGSQIKCQNKQTSKESRLTFPLPPMYYWRGVKNGHTSRVLRIIKNKTKKKHLLRLRTSGRAGLRSRSCIYLYSTMSISPV